MLVTTLIILAVIALICFILRGSVPQGGVIATVMAVAALVILILIALGHR